MSRSKIRKKFKGFCEQNALISVDGDLFWLKYCASNRYVIPSLVQKRLFYQKAVCDCTEMDGKIKLIVSILEYILESDTLNQAVESGKMEISIPGRITALLHSRTAGNELFVKKRIRVKLES
ncbi:hypothetical protein ACOME3_001201 [Neoechinorhynchus agilis]